MTSRTSTFLKLGGGVAAAVAGYHFLVRPQLLRWGATQDEVDRDMAGDDLVPAPNYVSTRAITIRATPEQVFPWLPQIGYGRGGLYSYDWLDQLLGYLDAPSADRILPELQEVKPGDVIPIGRVGGWLVRIVDPPRSFVVEPVPGKVSWAFTLYSYGDGTTRLVTRVRARLAFSLINLLLDPAEFVMIRRMLVGIKERAESLVPVRDDSTTRAPMVLVS
jgi:hypothetical protein